MQRNMLCMLLLSLNTKNIVARRKFGQSLLRSNTEDTYNAPPEQAVNYIWEPGEENVCDVVLEDIISGKFKQKGYKGHCDNKTIHHESLDDQTAATPSYADNWTPATPSYADNWTPAAPGYDDTLTPNAPSYADNWTPAATSYADNWTPAAPSFDDTLTPAVPSYDDTLTAATPGYDDTLTPAAPSYDDTLTPAAPSYDDTLTPATPSYYNSVPTVTEGKDIQYSQYDVLTSTPYIEFTITNELKPDGITEVNTDAGNGTLLDTVQDYEPFPTINSEEYEFLKKNFSDIYDDNFLLTENYKNYEDYTANLNYADLVNTVRFRSNMSNGTTSIPANSTLKLVNKGKATRSSAVPAHVYPTAPRQNVYWSTCLVNLLNIIVEKPEVYPVLKHMSDVVQKMYRRRELDWLEEPMLTGFLKLATEISASSQDEIHDNFLLLLNNLKERHKTGNNEINYFIDMSDNMVSTPQGEQMLRAVEQLKNYPNSNQKSDYEICELMIEAFNKPYSRRSVAQTRDLLVRQSNIALMNRFPRLKHLRKSNSLSDDQIDEIFSKIFTFRKRNTTASTRKLVSRRNIMRTVTAKTRKFKSLTSFNKLVSKKNMKGLPYKRFTKKTESLRKRKGRYFIINNREVIRMQRSSTRNYRMIKKESTISKKTQTTFHIGSQFSKPTISKQTYKKTPKEPMQSSRKTNRLYNNYRRNFSFKENVLEENSTQYNQTGNVSKDLHLCDGNACPKNRTRIHAKLFNNTKKKRTHKKLSNEHLHNIVYESSYSDEEGVLKMNLFKNLIHYNHSYIKI